MVDGVRLTRTMGEFGVTRVLSWDREGHAWPNHDASRFIDSGELTWHVQIAGQGPDLLLLHGTGASTHSWRDCLPNLTNRFRVIAPDLPGHGFTSSSEDVEMSLPGIAQAVTLLMRDLKRDLDVSPLIVAGHSAGAAIALRMVIDDGLNPAAAVSLNGALLPFPGFGLLTLPMIFKSVFMTPFAAPMVSEYVRVPGQIRQAIINTGTTLDDEGFAFYERLFANDRHLGATINMMTHWDLAPLKRDLCELKVPLTAAYGADDRAIPRWQADEVKQLVPDVSIVELPGCGHIAPEEQPQQACELVMTAAVSAGIPVSSDGG
jgi:magnesium chelatase accessory protein